MNKIILTLLMTILFTPAANAQNCVNSSRCDELGYTKTTADCAGLDTLVCPFDENKMFCISLSQDESSSPSQEKGCEGGDVLYSDMKCYSIVPPGGVVIGVVFDAENRLAVALDEVLLSWGGYGEQIGSAAQGTSGKSNTEAILAYGGANGIEYPAAEFCNAYYTSGTKAGDWFLPSLEELELLSDNFSGINSALRNLGRETITENEYYWSSSEANSLSARGLVPSAGATDNVVKSDSSTRVRPVLAF